MGSRWVCTSRMRFGTIERYFLRFTLLQEEVKAGSSVFLLQGTELFCLWLTCIVGLDKGVTTCPGFRPSDFLSMDELAEYSPYAGHRGACLMLITLPQVRIETRQDLKACVQVAAVAYIGEAGGGAYWLIF